jgi:hypothetical protein
MQHINVRQKPLQCESTLRRYGMNIMWVTPLNIFYQCCGSGSGIRCLFDPWIREIRIRIRDEQPGSFISESLETFFWIKILKLFEADP